MINQYVGQGAVIVSYLSTYDEQEQDEAEEEGEAAVAADFSNSIQPEQIFMKMYLIDRHSYVV